MSIRPIPYGPASAFSEAISSASESCSPSSETGRPALEADHDLGRRGRLERRAGQLERVLGRCGPRILEHAGLDRAADEVVVDRERLLGLRLDRDAARLRVDDLLVARPDLVAQRRDHLHARVARLEGELEAELVVALAGAAVDDRLGAEVLGDPGDRLGDDRPRERGDERVLALVERVREQRLRDLLVRERVLAVDEHDVGRAGRVAARDRRLEVGVLADVDQHRDDLVEAVVLLQPRDRAARVEPARVGEHRGPGHLGVSFQVMSKLLCELGAGGALAGGDEDRVVAGDAAGDVGQGGVVEGAAEHVRVAGRRPDDDEVAGRLQADDQRRSAAVSSREAVEVGGARQRVDEPAVARCAP